MQQFIYEVIANEADNVYVVFLNKTKCYACAYAHMVRSSHCLENHSTINLIYDIHYILLLDYNKQQFTQKKVNRLFQKVF